MYSEVLKSFKIKVEIIYSHLGTSRAPHIRAGSPINRTNNKFNMYFNMITNYFLLAVI